MDDTRTVTITFADNSQHIYNKVPMSVTPDQVEARANKDFPSLKVKNIDGGRNAPKPAETSTGEKIKGVAETAAALGSSVVTGVAGSAAKIPADLVKMTAENLTGNKNNIVGRAVDRYRAGVDTLEQKLTYKPQTKEGQEDLAGVGKVLSPVSGVLSKADALARRHLDNTVVDTAEDVLNVAGGEEASLGRGIRAVTKAPEVEKGVKAAEKAGYTLPISQARPGLLSRYVVEPVAGKVHTEQALSATNQTNTNRLVRSALGLPKDSKIDADALDAVRKKAGRDYEAIRNVKDKNIVAGKTFSDRMDAVIKSRSGGLRKTAADDPIVQAATEMKGNKTFTVDQALEEIKSLRNDRDKAFRAGDKKLAADYGKLSDAMENAIDEHLKKIGAPKGLVEKYRNSRQTIAQTYSVEKALDEAGNVDARKLARSLHKMRNATGRAENLKTAAQFGKQFGKYAKTSKETGSVLPYSLVGAASAGGLGALLAQGATHGHLAAGVVAGELTRLGLQKASTTKLGQKILGGVQTAGRKTARGIGRTLAGGLTAAQIAAEQQDQR